jgi:septal ring factor EnvC (AmiA/AmiB activator)
MRRFIFRVTAVLIYISVFFTIHALSWPSENGILVRNFGSNDRGLPVLGMIFSGGTDVLAAENGEVIFSRKKNDSASRLPSPLGAWTAVDHSDGLISIYSRYAEPVIPFTETQVEKRQPIAQSGVSGWSAQNGFYFMLFDRRERRWINPAMIITPVQETRSPQILSVDLRNAQ